MMTTHRNKAKNNVQKSARERRLWRTIDACIILLCIALFFAGKGIATQMYGVTSMKAANLTVVGDVQMRGSVGAVPTAAIMLFNTSCPTGWTRQTQFDSAMVFGAAAYSATPSGSASHTHTIGSHGHGVSDLDIGGYHTHTWPTTTSTAGGAHSHQQSASSICAAGVDDEGSCNGYWTSETTHTHDVSFSNDDGGSHFHTVAGTAPTTGSLAAQNNLPAYVQLVFCKKN